MRRQAPVERSSEARVEVEALDSPFLAPGGAQLEGEFAPAKIEAIGAHVERRELGSLAARGTRGTGGGLGNGEPRELRAHVSGSGPVPAHFSRDEIALQRAVPARVVPREASAEVAEFAPEEATGPNFRSRRAARALGRASAARPGTLRAARISRQASASIAAIAPRE